MKSATRAITLLFLVVVAMLFAGCSTPLINAAYDGDTKEMERLIAGGADVNELKFLLNGFNALHFAAWDGKAEAARLLIEKGADMTVMTQYGDTPLHLAALYGHTSVVDILLKKGADPAISSRSGKTPLAYAEAKGHTVIVGMLKRAEAEKYASPAVAHSTLPPAVKEIKSDVDELPNIKAIANKNAYAVVIGIENYRQKLPKADYAAHDAKTMTEYLTKVMGYPEENVITLVNDNATMTDFVKYFEKWLPNNVEKDGSVFIYYSGHGAPDTKTGGAFLVPYDGDPSFINETGYPLKRLYAALDKLPAKEIVVALDSCFSGAGGKSVIAKGARPLVMRLEDDIRPSKNMTVISASSGDEISSTYEEKGHGLFTYYLLKGIKGEGDENKDGRIEIGELYAYLKPQVRRIARKVYNNDQSPQLIAPDERPAVYLR